jgi:hypothetical protein
MSENPDMGHPAIVQRTSVLSGAEARVGTVGFVRGLKPPPPSVLSFSASCLVVPKCRKINAGISP